MPERDLYKMTCRTILSLQTCQNNKVHKPRCLLVYISNEACFFFHITDLKQDNVYLKYSIKFNYYDMENNGSL